MQSIVYITSEVVSEVGLFTEAEEKGLPCVCCCLPSAGVGVGVFRCSSIRRISMGGRTAMPPIGLRCPGCFGGGVVGEVTADDVNAAE